MPEGLTLDQLGELGERDKIERVQVKIRKSWSIYKKKKGSNLLMKAIFHAFRCKELFKIFEIF